MKNILLYYKIYIVEYYLEILGLGLLEVVHKYLIKRYLLSKQIVVRVKPIAEAEEYRP